MLIANCLRIIRNAPTDQKRIQSNIEIISLFDDSIRNRTEHPFSIQNIVEVGLNEHSRMPGEWYSVTKMNEIFQSLSYHFSDFAGSKYNNLKIQEFKLGEIILSTILELGFCEND